MADQITEEERQELFEKFCQYISQEDKENPDPQIQVSKMVTLLRQELGITEYDDKARDKALKGVELEKDLIKFSEFISIIARKRKEVDSEEELLEAFKVFDKEGTGYISTNELRLEMQLLQIPPEEIDEIIKEADTTGDGHIQYEEFIKTICKIK